MHHSDSTPAGFALYQRGLGGYSRSPELLVPIHLKPLLLQEEKLKEEELQKLQRQEELEKALEEELNRKPSKSNHGQKKGQSEEETEAQTKTWADIEAKDKERNPRLSYPVFRSEQAMTLFKNAKRGADKDDNERLDKVYQSLVASGSTHRSIARPKDIRPLAHLAATQGHMKEVVTYVMDQLNLARHSRKPVRLPPMLLCGEPGVGKTHFVTALAQALATSIYIQRMDCDLTSSFLMGSDKKWSNSDCGILFRQVVMGQHANPIIVLDELDKTARHVSYGSPLASLYSVLEPLSAKSVRDISLDFEFDVSQVTFIATCNDATLLDQPLRSRFREFHIMPPNAQECLVLAQEVMRSTLDAVGVKGFSKDVAMHRHLAHLPARQIFQLTQDALGKAVAAGRSAFARNDFPSWLFEDQDEEGACTHVLH